MRVPKFCPIALKGEIIEGKKDICIYTPKCQISMQSSVGLIAGFEL